jgi:hypothetical protein
MDMAKKSVRKSKITLAVPTWAPRLYIFLAIVLIPWTIYLGYQLPTRHLSVNWDVSWTGLDIGLTIALLATGLFAYTKSMLIIISSTITGSLLLVDAWFDVLSEHKAKLFHQALLSAIVFEIPLAIMSFYLALHALTRLRDN